MRSDDKVSLIPSDRGIARLCHSAAPILAPGRRPTDRNEHRPRADEIFGKVVTLIDASRDGRKPRHRGAHFVPPGAPSAAPSKDLDPRNSRARAHGEGAVCGRPTSEGGPLTEASVVLISNLAGCGASRWCLQTATGGRVSL
jgi:hypothetical protein